MQSRVDAKFNHRLKFFFVRAYSPGPSVIRCPYNGLNMQPLDYKFLPPAVIDDNNGQPYAKTYADVYFNDLNGLDETNHVFIRGNQLLERWKDKSSEALFCIAETGFGSGLNFLATCLAWQNTPTKPQHLHFISTELHPMSRKDLKSAHQIFPEIKTYSQKLLNQYHSFRCGIHHLKIDQHITLTLILSDATAGLTQLVAQVDAWYLDGFAPSRNPDMWSSQLFNVMAALSKPGTTLATYSAAKVVKQGLITAGFELSKQTGYGPKRDMLTGQFNGRMHNTTNRQPWHPTPMAKICHKKITILGGGIAGLSLARSFSLAGFHTTIIDRHELAFEQASGNDYAMVMPVITAQKSPESLFYLRAFEHAKKAYSPEVFHTTGVLETLNIKQHQNRLNQINELPLCEQLVATKDDNIYYQNAGFVDGPALVADWQQYVDQWLTAEVDSIEKEKNKCWVLKEKNDQTIQQCQLLVVAAGMHSQPLLDQYQSLKMTAKLGQTHQITTQTTLNISQVLLNQGYIIPVKETHLQGHYLLGATFDHLPETKWYQTSYNDVDHWYRNRQHWQHHTFCDQLATAQIISQHTAIRATTQDHLPICGPIINQERFKKDYQDLHHGRHWQVYPPASHIDDLYVMTGLGSRGFTSAPLLADYLMCMITGQPLPLEADLCKIIHPNRFLYRRLKKRH